MYVATQEHQPFHFESKSKGHPNKGLSTKHPVSGKVSKRYREVSNASAEGMSAL